MNAAESLLEAYNNHTASQDICPLATQRFITVFQESASKRCLTQMNPVCTPTSYLFKIHFKTPWP